jgi:hypothetical protein
MTKTEERIQLLAQIERELVAKNHNGQLDTRLYHVRKELDTLRLKARKRISR